MMLHKQQRLSRNITAAAWQNTSIGRLLCSAAAGSRGDTEIDKKNKPRARSDLRHIIKRPAGDNGRSNRLRPPNVEKNSRSSYNNGELHRIDRGGYKIRRQQHGSRSDIFPHDLNATKPSIRYNNFNSFRHKFH